MDTEAFEAENAALVGDDAARLQKLVVSEG